MLVIAVICFTIVIALGILLVIGTFRGRASSRAVRLTHAGIALIGLGFVIAAMLQGNARLEVNIALAVVVIVLGVVSSAIRAQKMNPSALIACHIGLALMFYLILVFFMLFPSF